VKNMPLTSLNRRSENIRVVPVVVAELELCDVQMQIFFADLLEGDCALPY